MIFDLLDTREKAMETLHSEEVATFINSVAKQMLSAKKEKKHILICGNGGSASQASHFVAELTVRYKTQHHFKAISLCSDYSVITAASNDYVFEDAFAMQTENFGEDGDLLIVMSTSGESPNVVNALQSARRIGMRTIAFLGCNGGEAKRYADICYIDKSYDTAIIQEHHLTLIHLVCEMIEKLSA